MFLANQQRAPDSVFKRFAFGICHRGERAPSQLGTATYQRFAVAKIPILSHADLIFPLTLEVAELLLEHRAVS